MGSILLQPTIRSPLRPRILAGAGLFLLAWALRLRGLHATFHPDDSPETILAGALGGIQHPPGYPLYSLLTRVAHLSLPGSAGYQTSLLAALLSSLSSVLLVWLACSWVPNLGGARGWSSRLGFLALVAGALSLPSLWFQGLSAKGGIYGLNLAVSLACLGLFRSASRRPNVKALRLGALLAGLGLADHYMSFVLFLPTLAWWSWQAQPNLRSQGKLALWLLPGVSLYLYLPLRALQHPFLNWGDPETPLAFWRRPARILRDPALFSRDGDGDPVVLAHQTSAFAVPSYANEAPFVAPVLGAQL